MSDRLTDIEIRYTHHERLLEELSAVLFEQRKTIDALEQRVRDLERRASHDEGPIPIEKPPHY